MNTNDDGSFRVRGILEIYDNTNPENEQLLMKKNAIHDGNMVFHIAKSMIGQDSSNTASIGWFGFGDGGSELLLAIWAICLARCYQTALTFACEPQFYDGGSFIRLHIFFLGRFSGCALSR